MKPSINRPTILERVVAGIGSPLSLVIHTLIFAGFFGAAALSFITWDMMLLFLTTIVSLEAIYLAIFIQMTVNQHTESLREVEEDIDEITEDIDEIQEDVEELGEDLDDIQEDLEEITEDLEEITEDEAEEKRKQEQRVTLEQLTADVRRVLADLEAMKEKK